MQNLLLIALIFDHLLVKVLNVVISRKVKIHNPGIFPQISKLQKIVLNIESNIKQEISFKHNDNITLANAENMIRLQI